MNQFFIMAIAEKVSALKTLAYFRERMARGDLDAFDAWMEAGPDVPPRLEMNCRRILLLGRDNTMTVIPFHATSIDGLKDFSSIRECRKTRV